MRIIFFKRENVTSWSKQAWYQLGLGPLDWPSHNAWFLKKQKKDSIELHKFKVSWKKKKKRKRRLPMEISFSHLISSEWRQLQVGLSLPPLYLTSPHHPYWILCLGHELSVISLLFSYSSSRKPITVSSELGLDHYWKSW